VAEGAIAGENGENGVSDLAVVGGEAVLVGVGTAKLLVFAMGGAVTRGAGVEAAGGAEAEDCVPAKMAPFSRLTRLGATDFPAKNSPAERAGSSEGAGGNISDWKLSAYGALVISVRHITNDRKQKIITLRGTMKAIGSIPDATTLYARAISQSDTLNARRGRKHMPRCGSADLCSERAWRASFSNS